jgi:hypothetical protein
MSEFECPGLLDRNTIMMMKLGLLGALFLVACSGSTATQQPTLVGPTPSASAAVTPESLEKDPLALFPGGALGMFSVDLRAFYASQSAGPIAAQVAEKYFPIGSEAGFSAARDLDRVTGGIYSMQGADVLATLIGRFDEAKLAAAAQAKTQTRLGMPVVATTYASRTLYTVSDVGFTIVSPHLVLAGTKTTIKRALDRMRDARLAHDAPAWMLQTIQTPAAAAALALNLDATKGGIPLASLMGGFPLKGTDGMTALRLLGNFQAPGMHIAGSATYADEAHAKAGAEGLRSLFGSTVFGVAMSALGVSVRDVVVTPAQSDAQIACSIDDASLRNFIGRLPSLSLAQ